MADDLRETHALDPFYVTTRYPDALAGAIPAYAFFDRESSLALDRATLAVNTIASILDAVVDEAE